MLYTVTITNGSESVNIHDRYERIGHIARYLHGRLAVAPQLLAVVQIEHGGHGINPDPVRRLRIRQFACYASQSAVAAGPSVRKYMTPQNVLDQFTMIKAQTKIMENGVAKDNSLRYTRTIDHYLPVFIKPQIIYQYHIID